MTRTRQARSCAGSLVGSPVGWGIRPALTMRFAPTDRATDVIDVMTTAGSPARSISLTSVAPQRVPVPQVAVMIMPSMPLAFISWAMACPMAVALATGMPQPTVEK